MKKIEITSKVILTLSDTEPTEKELAIAVIIAEQYLNSIPAIKIGNRKVYFRFHFDTISAKWELD